MEQVLDEEDEPDVQSRQAMRLKAEVRRMDAEENTHMEVWEW